MTPQPLPVTKDPVGNRLTEQEDGSLTSYTYNNLNQLLSTTAGGAMRFAGAINEAGTVKVDGQNARMLYGNSFEKEAQVTTGANSVEVQATDASSNVRTNTYDVNVSGTGATYEYDANGNLTEKVEGSTTWTYEWTVENKLKRVLKDGVEVATFAYDPLGRRVERTAGGAATAWTYDQGDILQETGSLGELKYIEGRGVDEWLAADDGSALDYFHTDALGSVTNTSDAMGAGTLSRRYDAWGHIEVGATAPGPSFTGREWEPDLGIYYYRARFYSPHLGRFMNEDPIRFGGGANFFSYVAANPVSRIDPSGMLASGGGGSSCCEQIRRRKKQIHCILDALEGLGLESTCGLSGSGGSTTCSGHEPSVNEDEIHRTNTPCMFKCALFHELRHASQCRRFGVAYLIAHPDAAEHAAYMDELGCLIRQERETPCCPE